MTTALLTADAASVTVSRAVASTAFGKYTLNVPEGVDLADIHTFAADGNELGYVAALSGRRVGGMMRRFVRADVSVTAANPADPAWLAESNVDQVLAEVEARVASDFFLESDITIAGLGPWQPLVDFQVGDLVRVLIWGRVVVLPVTRIEPIISDHSIVDWRVHVGGQLISDEDARLAENATIYRALIEDQRDLAGLEAQVSKAVSDASSAKATAEEVAATVAGLDIDSKVQVARDAVEASNLVLSQVRVLVSAAASQGAAAQASASMAIDYANQALAVLDELDPLRDDVVAVHAEVVRLAGDAAKYAQDAATHVAKGEQFVLQAQKSANSAAGSAQTAQNLVNQASSILDSTKADAAAAKKSLDDAAAMLANVDGSGKSLLDILKEVALKHQDVLKNHDSILAAHTEILTIHGDAIRWAAAAAAQAAQAAMSASMAADEALEASRLNSLSIEKLAEADRKLIEADQKLQDQINILEQSQRVLADAVKAVAEAAKQAAQAATSASMAAEENASAIAHTNIAVQANTDAVEAAGRAATSAQSAASSASKTAADAKTTATDAKTTAANVAKAQAAMEDTLLIQQNAIFWGEVHRTRIFDKYSMSSVTDNELMTMTPIESQRKLQLDFKGIWGGRVQAIARMVDPWGENSRVDFAAYGAAPGYRQMVIAPEVINYGVNKVHIIVDMWWPNRAMEFVFVPKSGGWETPPYEDSLQGCVNLKLMNEGTMLVYWPRGKGYKASRPVQSSPDDGVTWKTYAAGTLLPASLTIGGYSVTAIRPVAGDMRPVKLTEQI